MIKPQDEDSINYYLTTTTSTGTNTIHIKHFVICLYLTAKLLTHIFFYNVHDAFNYSINIQSIG